MKIDPSTGKNKGLFEKIHIDLPLLLGILSLMGIGLVIMYSATYSDTKGANLVMMEKQVVRMLFSLLVMFILAQIPPRSYEKLSEILYISGILLLLAVLLFGEISNGAQRWLDIKFVRFQPSELLKLAVPIMVAKYISKYPLPPTMKTIMASLVLLFIPTILIFKQPDLGTSILIAASGIFVIFLAGIRWRIIFSAVILVGAFIPVMWFFVMEEYQKIRVRTLFNPESDPLGAGYHIIQSKIAIGSGGWTGKGWLMGTQSKLDFIPERHTDFIFAVIAEEWGIIGVFFLLCVYLFIVARALYIANKAQTAFGRMLAGSLVLSFFVYIFVNIGMVSGILPVVGVPLPLISYGGTSMITLMAGFGIVMSIHTHRKLMSDVG